MLGQLLRNNIMNVAQLVDNVLQGCAQHARQHQALCSSGCDGRLVRGTLLALVAISEADLELRHVFLGEHVEGILCSL